MNDNPLRDEVLDLVRGLSALAVLAGHLRSFVLKDLAELANPGVLVKVFYALTSLGHQAVIVFFVLSGYLVGGGVCKALRDDRFSWKHYAMARLTRLWVVLIPALVLTWLFDMVGSQAAPETYAGGLRGIFQSGPLPDVGISSSGITFLGNLSFLQTVTVPVMGTNSPLWSLANEFWYYTIFPLLAVVSQVSRRPWVAVASFLLSVGLLVWLPWGLVSQGLIWLFGVGVWWIGASVYGQQYYITHFWNVGGACLFMAGLAVSKAMNFPAEDCLVGIAFAAWMPALLGPMKACQFLRKSARWLSEISFSLYVIHFPLLFLIVAVAFRGWQFEPNWLGLLVYTFLLITTVCVAWGFYWLCEGRTDFVRGWMRQKVNGTASQGGPS